MKHLTPADREALALRLDQMYRQAVDELRSARPCVERSALAAGHETRSVADEAEAERMDDVHLAEIEVDRARLHGIEQAQLRMAEGRYGICVECGEEIPRERLLAQPMAIRCAACQAAAEAMQRR
jgi:DnaK suppressor protein